MRPGRSLLPLPNVQFWETEDDGRLDSSHRGRRHRDIPHLVDASDVRAVTALIPARSRRLRCRNQALALETLSGRSGPFLR